MEALTFRGTWELVSTPTDVVVVSCRWVFNLKYRPDGSVNRYKARLVPRDILRHMASIILRHSRQLPILMTVIHLMIQEDIKD